MPDAYGRDVTRELSHFGPLARTVDDAIGMLDVMAGRSVPRADGKLHAVPFAELARRPAGKLRVRMLLTSPLVRADADVAAAVQRVARALESMGHHVDEGAENDGTLAEFLPLWQKPIWGCRCCGDRCSGRCRAGSRTPGGSCATKTCARGTTSSPRASVPGSATRISRIMPTVARGAPHRRARARRPGEDVRGGGAARRVHGAVQHHGPAGGDDSGGADGRRSPIGVQIVGRVLEDATVLGVCKELEAALPWSERAAPFLMR